MSFYEAHIMNRHLNIGKRYSGKSKALFSFRLTFYWRKDLDDNFHSHLFMIHTLLSSVLRKFLQELILILKKCFICSTCVVICLACSNLLLQIAFATSCKRIYNIFVSKGLISQILYIWLINPLKAGDYCDNVYTHACMIHSLLPVTRKCFINIVKK